VLTDIKPKVQSMCYSRPTDLQDGFVFSTIECVTLAKTCSNWYKVSRYAWFTTKFTFKNEIFRFNIGKIKKICIFETYTAGSSYFWKCWTHSLMLLLVYTARRSAIKSTLCGCNASTISSPFQYPSQLVPKRYLDCI
jgi:hypothetical protein